MRLNKFLLSMLCCAMFSVPALADQELEPDTNDGQVVFEDGEFVWDGIVSYVCIEQNELYAKTWYGRLVAEGDEYIEWRNQQKQSTLQCLKDKQLLPSRLCGELFTINKNTGEDFISKLYKKHKSTIDNLKVLNQCEK